MRENVADKLTICITASAQIVDQQLKLNTFVNDLTVVVAYEFFQITNGVTPI